MVMRRPFLFLVLISLLSLLFLQSAGCGGENSSYRGEDSDDSSTVYYADFKFVQVPDPLAGDNPLYPEEDLPMPETGVSFRDGQFSTMLTRVTEPDGIEARHEYSRFDPFNPGQSMIVLLTGAGDYAVYRTDSFPYNQPDNLVMYTAGIEDPRWDSDDPQLLWGLADFEIVRDNVVSGEREVVKDFSTDAAIAPLLADEPDIYRVTMLHEGEASMDRRYWAFILQGTEDDYRPRYIFCWDREEDDVLGLYEVQPEESDIDWVGMSPKGNWVLIGGMSENGGNLRGFTIADRRLQDFHRIDYTTSHADVGLDSGGNEVLVMQNYYTDYVDMLPLDPSTQPILEAGGSYEGTNRIPLLRLYYAGDSPIGLNSGVHVSCNAPGYCLVSTYIEEGVREQNWLDKTNVPVSLDPEEPRAFYLSKTYNTTGTYWEETHGTMSNDGSKVVWSCNWNRNPESEEVFLMQLDMPPGWADQTRSR